MGLGDNKMTFLYYLSNWYAKLLISCVMAGVNGEGRQLISVCHFNHCTAK